MDTFIVLYLYYVTLFSSENELELSVIMDMAHDYSIEWRKILAEGSVLYDIICIKSRGIHCLGTNIHIIQYKDFHRKDKYPIENSRHL